MKKHCKPRNKDNSTNTTKETDLGISVIRNGKKLTLEEARDGKGKTARTD